MISLAISSGITIAASCFTSFGVFPAIGLGIAVIYGAYKLYKYLKKRRQ